MHAPANRATDQPAEWGACAELCLARYEQGDLPVQATPNARSIGWRWHPSQRLDLDRIAQWLAQWPWQRAKLVIHGGNGWQSANAVEGQTLAFRPASGGAIPDSN